MCHPSDKGCWGHTCANQGQDVYMYALYTYCVLTANISLKQICILSSVRFLWVHLDKIGFGQLAGDKSEAGCLKCDIKGVSPAPLTTIDVTTRPHVRTFQVDAWLPTEAWRTDLLNF